MNSTKVLTSIYYEGPSEQLRMNYFSIYVPKEVTKVKSTLCLWE